MSRKKKAGAPRSRQQKKGGRHPVQHVAAELGVDRSYLGRRLAEGRFEISNGVTFAEAFDALTSKSEREADRSRRQKAEADSAELDAAEKKGLLMLKKDARMIWSDATIEIRKVVQGKEKWTAKELLLALAKIKVANT